MNKSFHQPVFYKLNKEVFFNTVKFKDCNTLLKAVKLDWNRQDIWLNGRKQKSFVKFLEFINQSYPEYLEKILMLCNQNAHFCSYNKIFDIISKYDYHFSTTSDKEQDTVKTEFNLSVIIKQGVVNNTYDVFRIENDVKVYRRIRITTIIDFSTLDPIVVKIEFLD